MTSPERKQVLVPMRSIYRSAEGERLLKESYDAALHGLPFPFEEKWVNTSRGRAHVLVAGPRDATPLFLWQGTASPGPFMLELYAPFIFKYRVYVADVPCQGKHCDTRLIKPIEAPNIFRFNSISVLNTAPIDLPFMFCASWEQERPRVLKSRKTRDWQMGCRSYPRSRL